MGFKCEFPPGVYYIGDPKEMLQPNFLQTIEYVRSGALEYSELDAFMLIHPFSTTTFVMTNEDGEDTLIVSPSKIVAIMSADITKCDRAFDDQRVVFYTSTVIELNAKHETIESKNSEHCVITVSHYDMDSNYEESDHDMITRLYAAQGVEY